MNVLISLAVFLGLGAFFVFINMAMGRFLRPQVPSREKAAAYECGEPAIGDSWVQFDLRFYIIALVFLVFDVEIALFYPWAVVFKEARLPALVDLLFFFGVLLVGYAYLWRNGYLEWVRSSVTSSLESSKTSPASLSQIARRDPEELGV